MHTGNARVCIFIGRETLSKNSGECRRLYLNREQRGARRDLSSRSCCRVGSVSHRAEQQAGARKTELMDVRSDSSPGQLFRIFTPNKSLQLD